MADKYRRIGVGGSDDKPNLDAMVSRNVLAKLRSDPPGKPKLAPAPGARGGGDADLVSSMAKRLAALERDVKERGALLRRVETENEALKAKLKATQADVDSQHAAPPDETTSGSCAGCAKAKSENTRLRNQLRTAWAQVAQMKDFLSDYGMVWVGEPGATGGEGHFVRRGSEAGCTGGGAPGGAQRPAGGGPAPLPPVAGRLSAAGMDLLGGAGSSAGGSPTQHAPAPPSGGVPPPGAPARRASHSGGGGSLPFAMQKLLAAVDELNQVAGDGEGRLVSADGGAKKLRAPEPVRLVLFRDGLQVHRSAPRSYEDPGSRRVLSDVLDGYFPYQLKAEFPDGVPLKIVDRTSEPMPSSSGAGSGSGGAASGAGLGAGNVHSFSSLGDAPGRPMTKENFLGKLPNTVIKNGKVIEVRSAVGAAMAPPSAASQPTPDDKSVVSTPADALLNTMQRKHVGPALPPGRASADCASAEITTLQVKTEDGGQTLILKLRYDDTIGALRRCIDTHRAASDKGGAAAGKVPPYEVRGTFPARAYADDSETLRDAGLVPNATLFLKPIKAA